jgi:hypothetical protein
MNRDKVERLSRHLHDGDILHLSRGVEYCGGYRSEPFKGLLVGTLKSGHDRDRAHRLAAVVSHLTEEEILWLCETE